MPTRAINEAIDLSMDLAVGEIPEADIGLPILRWMTRASDDIPPWWSWARDSKLREFWKKSSHLSMIMYTAQSLLVGVPMRVEAKDPSIVAHVEQAEFLTDLLMNVSEFGQTLYVARRKFVEDLLGQDNGAFMEVIGAGDPAGPIEGMPIAVRHLDSSACWRTSSPEYPVVYHDPVDGRAYKLHRSRVIYMSQMTSPMAMMNGVGYCAVSRAIQFAQHLYDIYVHKQEKLGSRPISTILVGAGFRGKHIMQAVRVASMAMDNEGLTRYSRAVGIGSDNPEASIEPLTLNTFDPFDEQTSVSLAVYGLVAAFGIPIQEVWPAAAGRAGREGSMQESRQRGKLPAEFNAEMELQIGQKYLPPHLKVVHDWRDDYQDERRAVNQDIRARNRERDLGDGAVTVQVSRQQMVEVGDITREQYITLELTNGRLEDGRPVAVLFYMNDKLLQDALDLGVDNPTATEEHDSFEMIQSISKQIAYTHQLLADSTSGRSRKKLNQALAALEWLRAEYEDVGASSTPEQLKPYTGEEPPPEGDQQEEEPPPEGDQEEAQEQEEEMAEERPDVQTRTPDESRPATVGDKTAGGPW